MTRSSAPQARLLVALGSLLVLLLASPPARAEEHELLQPTDVTFTTALACGPSCPDWNALVFNDGNGVSTPARCRKEPLTTPGSYDEILVTVPDSIQGRTPVSLSFTIYPRIDYEATACLVANPGTPNEEYRVVPHGVIACFDFCAGPCRGQLPAPHGCPERIWFGVLPGETYALRVFNASDGRSVEGLYGYAAR